MKGFVSEMIKTSVKESLKIKTKAADYSSKQKKLKCQIEISPEHFFPLLVYHLQNKVHVLSKYILLIMVSLRELGENFALILSLYDGKKY